MNLPRHPGRKAVALLAATLLLFAGACSDAGDTPAAGGQAGDKGKIKIALSNSFIGNQWRVEMENVYKAACAMPPYADQVECSVFNAGNDVSTQSRQISNLISQGVDAIVINAASTSGLNGVVQQACDRGIVIVSFDNTVDNKCGLTVNTDQVKFGQQLAQFIVDQLKGQGNVVMVTGVAGTGADNDRNKGAKEVFAANPGIKVVATYTGMWDSATAQRATSAQLPNLPKVDGVWVSGGTDGVIKAFAAAKRPMPVVGGEAENGFRKFMAGLLTPKVTGMSIGQPPFLSVISLELARAVVKGEHPKSSITIPFPVATSENMVPGETVFPDLPDSFFADFTDSGPNATVVLCQEAATDGTPCPGKTLDVNLGTP
ncbi:monosaccharide ABC transporter substrate-binding protein (CUT2 family) [Asanoa ferruginea]|uniref:Monosaccharide ABC transporter substrate-binding protein (CUT2 family) n=1 Tax=Asanoa ferruginea TaxID=53367 RepID=A0A3D9ZVI2_9ACTN|nr:sugar ABC transporter substrate-binding protein [Asanoa ferruginea]REG01206.1 monosaccharide ABC transporter substrate-binding protein (CUT2 family) [Asanoa ferruginea]